MIPLRLQESIKKRIEKLFENNQYQRPAKDSEDLAKKHYSKMNVFSQNLPFKEQSDQSFAPFAIVKINTGNQASAEAKHLVNVSILIGMYDESAVNGHRDVALSLTSIMNELKNNPLIEDMFELDLDSPIDWELAEEETYPFYFGGLSLHFKAPIIEFSSRKDVEGLI